MGTPKPGRVTLVAIETSSGSGTYTAIAGVREATLTMTRNAIEVTDKDSAGSDEFIPGNHNYQLQLSGTYEEDDSGLGKLLDHIVTVGETRMWSFKPIDGTSDRYRCSGFVVSTDINSPNKDDLTWNATIQLSGAPTVASASANT